MVTHFRTLLFILGFFWLTFASAFEVPSLTGPVVDRAGILSSNESAQIAERLHAIKAQGGAQIQVLIIPSLEGEAIEQVSIQVFDQWKLGDEKKDNGVLFVMATNDRKLRIEVGQGLEGNIPDIIAKRIVSEITRPIFKAGNYFAGIFLTTEAINQAASTPDGQVFDVYKFKEEILNNPSVALTKRDRGNLADRHDKGSSEKKLSTTKIFLILGVLWLIIFVFSPSTALWILFSLLSGGRGGGGGYRGGGGGGWSGGGGSSSGGGASGDW
ncbi:MAG: TPM domain-containing protein [Pseudobdellovibrio sp.]|nr:TPM domain-containing protein [Pseudobdellovibrio sp.]